MSVVIPTYNSGRTLGRCLESVMSQNYPREKMEIIMADSGVWGGALKLARMLMEKGWAVTLQSTIVMPYPGTKMYDEGLENRWFRVDSKDYERFDMTVPVLRMLDMEPGEVVRICDEIYKVFLSPKYVFRHLIRIRSWRDFRYSVKGVLKVLGHIKDFARG